ncbi:MAG TPA: S8 family serine peptidase [Chitinophagaceae bacterium]|nr:S8 family serine peptidase [Chitinophagaceae bacterium]
MRKKFFLLAAILVVVSCKKNNDSTRNTSGDDDCVMRSSTGNGEIKASQYIVAFSPVINSRTTSRISLDQVSKNVLQRNTIDVSALKTSFGGEPGGFIATMTSDQAEALRHDGSIEAVEPDRVISLGSCFTVVEPRLITWNINRIGYGNGIGKTAWIVDSGIDFDHPDLTVDQTRSRSFVDGQTSADDQNGHGTHVAGIIGAKNNTIGVLGVASGASLVALKVLDKDGDGNLSYIIQALAYINTVADAGDVVNMSVGGESGSDILDQQVKNTAARGIYFAIAAGNDTKLANLSSPARVNASSVYTVSAVDSLDNFASFSNYGNDVVDFAAPGVRILSTWMDNKYAYASGTSMAAPHVAGLLLLRGRDITSSGVAKNDPDGTPDPIAHY